ncbi:zinc finger, CCHC-type containing protein [Tanacetum coccineum]
MVAAMKHMASNFVKLDKFEGVDFRKWQKKMHFLLSSMSVVYVLTTPIPEDGENATMEQIRKKNKWDNDDYDSLDAKYMAKDASSKNFLVINFINYKMTDSKLVMEQYYELLDFKHTLKRKKDELTLVELGSHLCIEESLRMQDSDKPKGNNVVGPSVVNMMEHNNSFRYNDNKGKRKHKDTKADPNKKSKDDDVAWWVDSGATVHVCKDRCWFKTYESLNDGSIPHTANESKALVHRRGCVDLRFSLGKIVSLFNVLHVPNIRTNFVSSSILNSCGYKQVIESNKYVLSKHGVFIGFGYLSNQMFRLNIVNDNIGSALMSTSKLNDLILWHARLGHVHYKRMQDMSKDGLIPAFDMDTEKCKTCMLIKITKKPFQNVKRKTKVLEVIHSYLCDLHATPSLGNKKYFVTFIDDASRFCYVYLLHTNDEAFDKFKVFKNEVEIQQGSLVKRFRTDRGGLSQRVLGAGVRLLDPKLKTLGERGIKCIFFEYAEHSKAFRFYVIEPNEAILINSIIESKDAIFYENRFSSVPRSSLRIPNGTEYIGGSMVPEEVPKEVTEEEQKYEVSDQYSYCFNVEDDPKTINEAMKFQNVAFWKESINDEMDSIMGNNTWVLVDLPSGCKPLGSIPINRGLIQAIPTSLPPQPIGEATKAFNLRRIPPGVQERSHFTYFLYLIIQIRILFSMKDMREADIILGIRIKHESNGIAISQSYYIDKVLKKLNYIDCTLVSTPMDRSERLMPNNGQVVSQIEYSKVLKYFKKTMDYSLTYTSYPLVLNGYTNVCWISNTEYNLSTNGWVFLLGGVAISWASKKQTCITSSTMESEFVALAATGKETEWLRNLILEILLCSKPIAPISILYDSAATLEKAYSQMYNGKSRHLGVRHSMIHELIMNGMVSIEFVRP